MFGEIMAGLEELRQHMPIETDRVDKEALPGYEMLSTEVITIRLHANYEQTTLVQRTEQSLVKSKVIAKGWRSDQSDTSTSRAGRIHREQMRRIPQ